MFVERGFENTYLLTGGLNGICSRCPHILTAFDAEESHD